MAAKIAGVELQLGAEFRNGLRVSRGLIVTQVGQAQIVVSVGSVLVFSHGAVELGNRLLLMIGLAVDASEVHAVLGRVAKVSGQPFQ